MDVTPLKLGELTAKIPLLQAGMGVGVSLGNLAGAVAKAGGIGVISSAQIGFREPDFDTDVKAANERALVAEIQKAKALAPEGLVGVNIMVALKHYKEHVMTAVSAGADLIISGAGLPTELPKYVQGAKTKIAPIVSSVKAASVILKFWDKKFQRVPDLLVVEGPKAGGHLGFSKEDVESFDDLTYDKEVKGILEVVKEYALKYQQKIPVAFGGGIESRADAQHAFSLGVDAIQVATRFITSQECDADIRYKEAYVAAKAEDVVITKSPVGMPGRALQNQLIQRVNAGEKIPHSPCHQCLAKCKPSEIPYCITDTLTAAAKGEIEKGLLFCGAKVYKQNKIETVPEIIASIMG